MPTYVSLVHMTQKGTENIKESPTRIEKFKKIFKGHGGEVKEIYYTLGQYDCVMISEAPSDEAYATILLTITAVGSARAETLRAFPEAEYHKLVAAVA